MVVDTSALVCIEKKEHDAAFFAEKIASAGEAYLSAVSHLEFSMVTVGRGDRARVARVDALLRDLDLRIVGVDQADALIAREAFLRYGKGRHAARLNFGDCFSYALAKRMGKPLLFKGEDFSQTDVLSA